MQDDAVPITHETEEAILKSLTDAVFEANHLSTQFDTEDEKKMYNHYAANFGAHTLMRDLAMAVDTPIEHQIQLVRKIHGDIDLGAQKALKEPDATAKDVVQAQLLKMDDLPASLRVLGDLSGFPDQYKNRLIYPLVGFFAAVATKGEENRALETINELALILGQEPKALLAQYEQLITSLSQNPES